MADQQQQSGAISAAFPAPPPFYKHFTEQNLSRLRELQQQEAPSKPITAGPAAASPSKLLDLPPELRFLIPPEPPTSGLYRSFGDQYNASPLRLAYRPLFDNTRNVLTPKPQPQINAPLPTLADQGITQLYPSRPPTPTPPTTSTSTATSTSASASEWTFDHAFHLRKLAKSLLLNFLELIGTLAVNPEHYGRKIEDLRTLFINMHHLINEYRPHQARESLIMMMEAQIGRSRAEVRGIREVRAKVEEILEGLREGGMVVEGGEGGEVDEEERKGVRRTEEERRVWETLERELGGDGTDEGA